MENQKPKVGVGVMILKDNKVLLGQRHFDPKKADSELHGEGTWTMPGGKLDFQEKLVDCALREVFEETGIRLDSQNMEVLAIQDDIVPDNHFVTIGFLCKNSEGDPKIMEPDEITKWEWFGLDNLPKPIFPPSEKLIKKFLKNI
jgi:8-oxo-dGTP diphosphatase